MAKEATARLCPLAIDDPAAEALCAQAVPLTAAALHGLPLGADADGIVARLPNADKALPLDPAAGRAGQCAIARGGATALVPLSERVEAV